MTRNRIDVINHGKMFLKHQKELIAFLLPEMKDGLATPKIKRNISETERIITYLEAQSFTWYNYGARDAETVEKFYHF